MTIIRAPRRESHFTTLGNNVIRDQRVSYRASGVLHDILSRPDNWRTDAETLARSRPYEGREAIRTALRELKAAGYVEQKKIRDPETGRISTVSYVYDEPRPTVDQAYLDSRKLKRDRQPPGPKKPASGKPSAGGLGPLESTVTKDCEEETQDKIIGFEASFEEQREYAAASPLRGPGAKIKPKPVRDPKPRNTTTDDHEAATLATEHLDNEETADLVVEYLRKDRNASTTAGHVRHLIGDGVGGGLAEVACLAEEWDDRMYGHRTHVVGVLRGRGWSVSDVDRVADAVVEALKIRCTADEVNAAAAGSLSPSGMLAALSGLVRARERVRVAERRDRVRRQSDT